MMKRTHGISAAMLALGLAATGSAAQAEDYIDSNGANVQTTDDRAIGGGGSGEQAVHDAKAYDLQQEQARTMEAQLAELRSQMSELQQQTEEARLQNKAITGSSGKGQISTRDYAESVPRNWRDTLNAFESVDAIGNTAREMKQELDRQSAELANASDEESVNKMVEQGVMRSINGSAINATSYNASVDRIDRLKQLQGKIDETSTLKEIVDLQARIQIENGMMTNELIRMQSTNAMLQQTEYANAYQSMKDMAIRSDTQDD
jgi:type IV secretion system protein VirB5